jgi:hypothetical protein
MVCGSWIPQEMLVSLPGEIPPIQAFRSSGINT